MPKKIKPLLQPPGTTSEKARKKILQKKWIAVVVVAAILVGIYLAFRVGRGAPAPTFSGGDTWTWAGTTLGADNENAAFTRTDRITGKHARLGRECWVFRSARADNAGAYSLNHVYIGADGWYGAGSESFSDNLKMGETVLTGPILLVEFPLRVGRKWIDVRATSGYDNAQGIGSMDLQMTSRGEVLLEETVRVPAGNFETYKIEFTTLLNGTGEITVEGQVLTAQISTTITGIRWYSPAVKNFVKETSDTTMSVTVLWTTTTIKTHAEMELTGYSLGG